MPQQLGRIPQLQPANSCWLWHSHRGWLVDCTTNGYAHHRPVPPWTARTGRRDIARGRIYSRLGRGPGGLTDLHAARPTQGAHHCREVPRKDDTTATFSLQLERAKWAEIFFRLMDGILDMGHAV